jgi:CheY-like chemotaxis protein
MVTHLGYAVTLATSSPQALRLFQAAPHRFDLLITDREMPGLTGLELAAACRQTRPDLPILLCTGSPRPMEAARGMDAVLMKPFNLETLGTTIAQVLARRASRDA